MNITLTPEIEKVLGDLAKMRGTTIELLAIETLREGLSAKKIKPPGRTKDRRREGKTLADSLTGYVGVIDSGEILETGAQMSTSAGKKFADILIEKRRQGRL